MSATSVPLPFQALPAPDLLADLLAVSLTGIIYYTPLYDPAGSGEIVDFIFEYLNPTAQRMMSMPERPVVTHNEQWPHSKAHGTFAFHVDAYVSGEPREYNINYQADGYDNYYRLAARRSGDGLWVSFTDTADQSRSPVEVALRESQTREKSARAEAEIQRQRFYEVLMQLPAHVAVHEGPELVFTLVNPHYQRVANGRELLGQPIRTVWPELAGQGILDELDRVYQTGEPFVAAGLPVQVDFKRTGQLEQAYYDFFFLALRDAQDQITGVLNFSYDVTSSVRARQQIEQLNQELETRVQERTAALQESEARFRIMADAAPNQVWAVNPDTTIRYANQAFLDFVGVSLEQYITRGWANYLPAEEMELAQTTLETAIRTRSLYVLEHRMRRHDGQYRWLLAQGAPSFYANGELYGYVGSAIDITELKQANEQLTRTNSDLDNFIYTASHDLKAPISNIEGLLHTLQSELPAEHQNAEVAYILSLMQDSVDRFTRTIEHLTDVSKLQKEHDQPQVRVALADIIEDVRLDLAPLLRQTGGQLQVEVQATPTVLFTKKNLRSVVYNLLSNALKYHQPQQAPQVCIRSWQESDFHVLEVQDQGLGIDLKREQQLFTMFRRYHTHVGGSGLGLYMVKRMIENAGGRIEVQSDVGQGATFRVYFPR
ncbi:sensor histidine kinase [Hymenobacter metallilatus]|uniref:histidine kinase n=1 Tax=Hymenobacter metallilatus TaxID=2493666 RepID=A0A3R9M2B2_9BACT|nr:PAS domain-containing protein [Hymenobacter metallilatus]RSK34647.1 PAS domain-containing sensor histidine kinase [Hymenobacter metallilatus]